MKCKFWSIQRTPFVIRRQNFWMTWTYLPTASYIWQTPVTNGNDGTGLCRVWRTNRLEGSLFGVLHDLPYFTILSSCKNVGPSRTIQGIWHHSPLYVSQFCHILIMSNLSSTKFPNDRMLVFPIYFLSIDGVTEVDYVKLIMNNSTSYLRCRLMQFNPRTSEINVLTDGLHFANGVQISHDGSFVLICETGLARVLKWVWLSSSRIFVKLYVKGPLSKIKHEIGSVDSSKE